MKLNEDLARLLDWIGIPHAAVYVLLGIIAVILFIAALRIFFGK